jgi:hypothetical protein
MTYPAHYFLDVTDAPDAFALMRDMDEAYYAYEKERLDEYEAEVRLGLAFGNHAERD